MKVQNDTKKNLCMKIFFVISFQKKRKDTQNDPLKEERDELFRLKTVGTHQPTDFFKALEVI